MLSLAFASPAQRQLQLDPDTTEVDTYDSIANLTGDPSETSDDRHMDATPKSHLRFRTLDQSSERSEGGIYVTNAVNRRAKERGWGEVFFGSYSQVIETCEVQLNGAFTHGQLNPWWNQIIDVEPARWQAHPLPVLSPLTREELRKVVNNCWFPVHAVGYNWLQSNSKSAEMLANRIRMLIDFYKSHRFDCHKVILITHSMGGLVARAAIHEDIGNAKDLVLGVVHGVQPATGAPAAYRRIRCGTEDGLLSVEPKVLGNEADEVTAVLANSPGGLQLLPSKAYGREWLRIYQRDELLLALPKSDDPYEELYKPTGNWWSLLVQDWINPAGSHGAGIGRTRRYLDQARDFHETIQDHYHPQTFAHFGVGTDTPTLRDVTWMVFSSPAVVDPRHLELTRDDRRGNLTAHATPPAANIPRSPAPTDQPALAHSGSTTRRNIHINIQSADGEGDQTVPTQSAEDQQRHGGLKGLFRQKGYQHQSSYKDDAVILSTLYSVVRIAEKMNWNTA